MVDENVTLADLKTVLKLFASSYLGDEVPVRIRPSFFPFTEPSVEADYFWDGKWVEFGGAGVGHPEAKVIRQEMGKAGVFSGPTQRRGVKRANRWE